jgi:tRNA pseudouridine55 synthase
VRAVARDLGRALGTGAYLTELRRTRIGGWRVDQAVALEHIADEGERAAATVSLVDAIAHLPAVNITEEQARRLAHGQGIEVTDPATPDLLRALCNGQLIAVLDRAGNVLRPHKVLITPE